MLWYQYYLFNILQKHCTNDESELIDGCIEDNYDAQQMHINFILSNVSYYKIQKAWHVVRIVASGSKKLNKKFIQDHIYYSKSYRLLQTVLILVMEAETEEEKLINTIALNLNDTVLNQKQENNICSTPAQEQENSICSMLVKEQENNIQVINSKIISVKGQPSKKQKNVLEQKAKKLLSAINENLN
ncbi:12149_t:CDS:2 [Cetraspora pellucida]|uniref:12149_t:CDS:1 n=1 Tax=Cetraspora pellucida TaxID=1433469 RepID=A0A9N8ZGQ9_9GLOM|nr:12149_t:CDS:2 [Cetraspora pellucida]